jgi:hypothetical protein
MVWFQNFNQNGEEVLQLKKKKNKKKIDEKFGGLDLHGRLYKIFVP